MSTAIAARDLLSRPWARATWYGLALVAIIGVFIADHRALLWTVSFGASGLLSSANAVRSRRFHSMHTGPIVLAGAFATALRTAGVISLSWTPIGAGVFRGAVGALAWERTRNTSSNHCC